jgi:hypothetical protein
VSEHNNTIDFGLKTLVIEVLPISYFFSRLYLSVKFTLKMISAVSVLVETVEIRYCRLIIAQLVKKSFAFGGTQGYLPCSQESSTDRYPEQANSVCTFSRYFFKIHLNVILPSRPRPSK